jgi:hypothetical protein
MKAFPSRESIYGSDVIGVKENSGMDLRDYFAGQIVAGLLADGGWGGDLSYFEDVAKGAYRMADAMMEAREK